MKRAKLVVFNMSKDVQGCSRYANCGGAGGEWTDRVYAVRSGHAEQRLTHAENLQRQKSRVTQGSRVAKDLRVESKPF